ncbi:Hint domain-containing protein [Paracoccus sp. Ld10]|uniref:Hint domain-containing protein n=1 Tax=Paracoccus sp. Ld10 TaxID=649158 RepID=UPI00386921E4
MAEATWMWFGREPQINSDYRTALTDADANKIEGYSRTGPNQIQAVSLDGTLRDIHTSEGNTQAFSTTYNNHTNGYSVFNYVSPATGAAAKAAITGFMSVKYELTLPDGTPWQGTGVLIQMHNGDMFFRPAKTEIENWEVVPEIKSIHIIDATPLPATTFVAPVSFSRNIFDVQVVCFCSGTLISTPRGQIPIENLVVGDLVNTLDRGPQPVRWHGTRHISASELAAYPKLRPIRISAGSLGENHPLSDLMVSRQHRILVRSKIAQRMFGTMELLVPAIVLTELPGIEQVETDDAVTYHHLLFDHHEVITANGAESESLFNGPHAAETIGSSAVEEINHLWPGLLSNCHGVSVRPFHRGHKVRKMLSRHQAHSQPLT